MSKIHDITPHLFPSTFDPAFTLDFSLSHDPNSYNKKDSLFYKFSDFPNHLERPQLMFWMIQAFKAWSVDKKGSSRQTVFCRLKQFYIFLQDANEPVYYLSDISPTVMDNYERWLKANAKRQKRSAQMYHHGVHSIE